MTEFLAEVLPQCRGTAALLLQSNFVLEQQGAQAAAVFLDEALQEKQSLVGLQQYINMQLQAAELPLRDTLVKIAAFLGGMIEKQPLYFCTQCGFSGKSLHWQCPGCRGWNAIKPVQSMPAAS